MGTDSNGNREERADRGWSADAYDHSFIYEYDEGVVDLLDPRKETGSSISAVAPAI